MNNRKRKIYTVIKENWDYDDGSNYQIVQSFNEKEAANELCQSLIDKNEKIFNAKCLEFPNRGYINHVNYKVVENDLSDGYFVSEIPPNLNDRIKKLFNNYCYVRMYDNRPSSESLLEFCSMFDEWESTTNEEKQEWFNKWTHLYMKPDEVYIGLSSDEDLQRFSNLLESGRDTYKDSCEHSLYKDFFQMGKS